jgi:xylan 1,4-beta-xylosidase
MMDANSVGRLTALSPVTWHEGWPYFGLPGNLGRTPRTWVKPDTGAAGRPRAPYQRSDEFSGPELQPVWQWNHVPVDGKWSLTERRGFLRLHALPAADLWHARNTLTQRAIGPRSTVTAVLETAGLKAGDIAGLALFNRPYAWLGVERREDGLALAQFDEVTGKTVQVPVRTTRVWLRAECDFISNHAQFSYSTDGRQFHAVGERHTMAYGLITFQGVRYSLFAYNTRAGSEGGIADFDAVRIIERARRAIPYGRRIRIHLHDDSARLQFGDVNRFQVVDRGLGRIALKAGDRYVSVDGDRGVSLRRGGPGRDGTFQWIETFEGHLTLMSLAGNRFLRIDRAGGRIVADSPGPRPDGAMGSASAGSLIRAGGTQSAIAVAAFSGRLSGAGPTHGVQS